VTFRYLLRVRYGECDAQGIVYNARWADYVDLAAGEFTRALFGSVTAMELKLAKLTIEWRASARFDDVLELRVATTRVGTTSYETRTEIVHHGEDAILATADVVYVAIASPTDVGRAAPPEAVRSVIDVGGAKRPITPAERERLLAGAPGVVVDHAGVTAPAAGA
jgi:acyl-CoA thioester hydrolase